MGNLGAKWWPVVEATFEGRLLDLVVEPLGTGQVAATCRLRLRWAPDRAGPATLIAKTGAGSAESRRSAHLTRAYERELFFYQHLADEVATRTPTCHHAARDEVGAGSSLLLEDVGGRAGDQLVGCTPQQAAAVLGQVAHLHAATIDPPPSLRSRLDAVRLPPRVPAGRLVGGRMFGRFVDRFLARPGCVPSRATVDLLKRIGQRDRVYPPADRSPTALIHGDLRSDNVVFLEAQATVLDWQTIAFGSPLADVSYFLGTSLTPTERRRSERDLVEHYRRCLQDNGILLDGDRCWRDYQAHSIGGVVMTVIAASLVGGQPRGDEMFLTMVERAAAQVSDHDDARPSVRPA